MCRTITNRKHITITMKNTSSTSQSIFLDFQPDEVVVRDLVCYDTIFTGYLYARTNMLRDTTENLCILYVANAGQASINPTNIVHKLYNFQNGTYTFDLWKHTDFAGSMNCASFTLEFIKYAD